MLSKNLLNLTRQHVNNNIKMVYSSVTNKTQATTAVSVDGLKSIDDIPGPKKYPYIGSLFSIKSFGGDIDIKNGWNLCAQLKEKYGDIVHIKIFNSSMVHVFDAEMTKKIFQAQDESPIRLSPAPFLKYFKYRGIPLTLTASNGERWRNLRSASNPVAARPQTVQLFLPEQNKVADDLINLINESFDKNSNSATFKNLENHLKTAALELVSVIAFDERIKCIRENNHDPAITALVSAVDDFLVAAGHLIYEYLPYGPYFPIKMWRRFVAAADKIYGSNRKLVLQAHEQLKTKSQEYREDLKSRTILEQYLLTMDKYGLNLEDIIALTSDFLTGGIDTTSTVIHCVLYELGRHPDIQEKLYAEVKQHYTDGVLTEDKLAKMPYLKAVVKEVLRMHPIVSSHARQLKDDLVLNDYLIPKGTLMLMGQSQMSKSERYFKNPKQFDPSRWLKSETTGKKDSIHPHAYLPFGFGARQCVGRRIAEQEIHLLVTKMIYNYKVKYIGENIGSYITRLVSTPDKPLDVILEKRV